MTTVTNGTTATNGTAVTNGTAGASGTLTAASSGLLWDQARGCWVVRTQQLANIVFGDSHVSVVQDPRLATSHVRPADEVPTVSEFFGSWFSRSPRHRQVRKRLRPPYSAGLVAALESMFTEVATEFVAGLGDTGDLMTGYLTPYGVRTTARMLDVPEQEWENLTKVVTVITAFLKKPLSSTFQANSAELRRMQVCIRYLRALVERLFDQPDPGPLVQALQHIADEDDASIWLAVTTVGQLIAAGVEPMTTGAGVACRELYRDPDLLARVVAGTVDIGQVAEEALRLNPPFPYIHRWVQKPCDCLGVRLTPGTYLVIDVGAVNRDPAVLAEPNTFRPQRPKQQNQTFGRGAHYCLGMRSGRLQMAVALRTLLTEAPELRVDVDRIAITNLGYVLSVDALPFRRAAALTGSRASL